MDAVNRMPYAGRAPEPSQPPGYTLPPDHRVGVGAPPPSDYRISNEFEQELRDAYDAWELTLKHHPEYASSASLDSSGDQISYFENEIAWHEDRLIDSQGSANSIGVDWQDIDRMQKMSGGGQTEIDALSDTMADMVASAEWVGHASEYDLLFEFSNYRQGQEDVMPGRGGRRDLTAGDIRAFIHSHGTGEQLDMNSAEAFETLWEDMERGAIGTQPEDDSSSPYITKQQLKEWEYSGSEEVREVAEAILSDQDMLDGIDNASPNADGRDGVYSLNDFRGYGQGFRGRLSDAQVAEHVQMVSAHFDVISGDDEYFDATNLRNVVTGRVRLDDEEENEKLKSACDFLLGNQGNNVGQVANQGDEVFAQLDIAHLGHNAEHQPDGVIGRNDVGEWRRIHG